MYQYIVIIDPCIDFPFTFPFKGYWYGTNGPVKPDVIRRRENAAAVKVNSSS